VNKGGKGPTPKAAAKGGEVKNTGISGSEADTGSKVCPIGEAGNQSTPKQNKVGGEPLKNRAEAEVNKGETTECSVKAAGDKGEAPSETPASQEIPREGATAVNEEGGGSLEPEAAAEGDKGEPTGLSVTGVAPEASPKEEPRSEGQELPGEEKREKEEEVTAVQKGEADKGEKPFRITAKKLFVTYPQTGEIMPKEALESLQETLVKNKKCLIKSFLITREEHKKIDETTGEKGFHLHAYLELTEKPDLKSNQRLKLKIKGREYGGHITVPRSKAAVQSYISKNLGPSSEEEGTLVTNLNKEEGLSRKEI
jgi:hypothetical protein